mmetsp:Transcript_23621/g.69347  ORF Transcript_23621/g.69347 Transcript_23621/m.69347 type:complete len:91 (+) Transcript_23621:470-742(+)
MQHETREPPVPLRLGMRELSARAHTTELDGDAREVGTHCLRARRMLHTCTLWETRAANNATHRRTYTGMIMLAAVERRSQTNKRIGMHLE